MQPRKYILDGQTESITSSDLQTILSLTHSFAYLYWPIYRVHVISANKVEVWYGRRDRDTVDFVIWGREPKRGVWAAVSAGSKLRTPPPAENPKLARKLDPRKRAVSASLTWGFDVTDAEFRNMQRSYRPESFNIWKKKISQLQAGMTEKQLMKALQAREVSARTESTSTYGDVIILDDAYCILVLLDKRERLMDATGPVAMTYHIVPAHKKP